MDLSEAKRDFSGVITQLTGNTELVSRLMDLGFVRGETVLVHTVAPFGEPLLVEVRGTLVALRKNEAQCIRV